MCADTRREIALNKSTSIEQELELEGIGRFLRFRQPILLFGRHFETSSVAHLGAFVWIIRNLVSRSKVARSGWSSRVETTSRSESIEEKWNEERIGVDRSIRVAKMIRSRGI